MTPHVIHDTGVYAKSHWASRATRPGSESPISKGFQCGWHCFTSLQPTKIYLFVYMLSQVIMKKSLRSEVLCVAGFCLLPKTNLKALNPKPSTLNPKPKLLFLAIFEDRKTLNPTPVF